VKRIFFVTGRPGVGKTTVLLRVIENLKAEGYLVGGMLSREVRRGGTRIGFEILDLATGKIGWLAHANQLAGPRIGKYKVNLKDLNSIGVRAILEALKKADVIAIDEVGPMELCSQAFIKAVKNALESIKPVIGTAHFKARHQIINYLKSREDSEIFEVTLENRTQLHKLITERILMVLKKRLKLKG